MFKKRRKQISRYYFELAESCPDWFADRVKAIKYLKGHPFLEKDSESLTESELLRALSLKEMYFFEVYRPENFHKLEEGTGKLFGSSSYYISSIDRYSEFFDELYHSSWGGWKHLGSVFPPNTSRPAVNAKAYSELPDAVERVDLILHKILPSLAVVIGRMILSEEINNTIKKILTEEYRTEVELGSLVPWQAYKSSRRYFQPGQQRKYKFNSLLNGVQAEVENTLRSDFSPGYFISSAEEKNNSPKCPSFRVFLASPYTPIIRVISDADYRKDNRELLDCLSIGPMDYRLSGVYVGENSIFLREPFLIQSENRFSPWSIVGFPDIWSDEDIFNDSSQFTSLNSIFELMKHHIYYFSLDSLLTQLSGEVAENRRSVLTEVDKGKSFKNLTRINREVSRSEDFLEALEKDLTKHKESIRQYVENRWFKLKRLKLGKSSSAYLPDLFEEKIENETELIRVQSSLTKRSIQNEVSLKNIEVNYRLQLWIVFLTFGLLALAFSQVYSVIPWSEMINVFMKIPYYWSKIT